MTQEHHTIIKIREVMGRVNLSRSVIYKAIKYGDFPKPIKISTRGVGWIESEIQDWITARMENR